MVKLSDPYFNKLEIDLLTRTLKSGWVTEGKNVEEFEKKFNKIQKSKFSLATNSCTSALLVALKVLGVKKNDEVIVPAFSWTTTANVVEFLEAKCVFVDIDRKTYNIDYKLIKKKITKKTKVIIGVHLFGLSCNIDKIVEICDEHKLHFIEDAACALKTKYKNRLVGNFGVFSAFSFHPRKLITTGEGGILAFKNSRLYKIARGFINHGMTANSKYKGPWSFANFNFPGINLKMSDISGAVGVAQLFKINNVFSK